MLRVQIQKEKLEKIMRLKPISFLLQSSLLSAKTPPLESLELITQRPMGHPFGIISM
jgi:hypothetical protein